ncbi:30S ribosomal protein S27 [candidate division MSBL1 archaeon SCGC-AAA382F02]|uniref:30S ribosomal protein S27 n=1 Tax=candidate division MSBL1 archaeon SCGC-AAA382F02 TaxID=1698282 RepID=A0A133VIC0_9EURY|nr:30S ribosomal protein S27 [candidate division MSBL1 archaeon SCGC-AAA382F02]
MEDEEIKRLKKPCPRCGPGIFMADHDERLACGKCGYTEFETQT